MYLYLIGTIKYSDKFSKIKYNTWKSSAVTLFVQCFALFFTHDSSFHAFKYKNFNIFYDSKRSI